MEVNKITQGDCLEKLKELEDNSIDSIVTDPPYELGFMGKSWDNTGIANNVDMWRECLRVLKPGGHLLSFGGTRTYHRMAVAIEDAGFEVRDMIEWVYGSGFPKSHNIGKAVDKLQGNEREVLGTRLVPDQRSGGINSERTAQMGVPRRMTTDTKGTSEWEGWGTALKPSHEPVVFCRKPLEKGLTVAENVLKYGTGGINIDESRVGTEEMKFTKASSLGNGLNMEGGKAQEDYVGEDKIGRFPANLIHDNSEEVRECFPDNSSRFFKSIIYQAKASKSERNKGMDELEAKPMYKADGSAQSLEIFGSTDGGREDRKNNHPTVKPIALMEYLIKMVTPKGGIVLDPFMGSGSTGVAAKQNGFDYVGIEREEEYIKIAEARLKAVVSQKTLIL